MALDPQECVKFVEAIAKLLASRMDIYDFAKADGFDEEDLNELLVSWEFDWGEAFYPFTGEENSLFFNMMKPHFAQMIKRRFGVCPVVIWPGENTEAKEPDS